MATQRRKRLAAMALWLLLVLCAGTALAQGGVVSGTTISGTVRVYLSSIASNTSVDVSVDGSYSIGGDASRAIARGTQLNIRNSGGTLLLTMNGQTQTMGSRFKIRRHQTTGDNGVRIAQARYPGSLYPGDVEFIANGGNVQIVVHVYMEDYMRGVLPYEMDNSFPLEALKAQAVAARTYALKKMSAQAATYDVVDTTSDQVYNGTPTGNARCAQAVEETSGIVGTVGGEYMASYYTASNGGQTESVANAWGSGSYSYLQVKDDPYDLRNPASVAKSVTFYRDGTTSVSALTALLRTETAALIGAQDVSIEAITAVTPHTPRYGVPSRVYQKLDVGLRLAGYGDVTVTLDYFSQVEGLCGLSINVLKNETLDVTETVGGYRLTARRYGHGVGMSQRGAQQMASEGMTYDQILEFYYPGLTRTKYTMTRTILPALDGTQETPQEPVTDAKIAVVTLKNPLDSLNLRREPGLSAPILATMPHGTQVTLLEQGEWCRVQYGTLSGYVKGEYLRVQEDEVEETPPATQTRGTATVALSDESQTLNLRAAPTLGSAVLARLRHGQVLTVLERYESWTYVQTGTLEGYVSNDYIIYDADGGMAQPEQTPQPGTEGAQTAIVLPSDGLNLRAQPSRTSGVIMTLPQGTMLTVTGEAVGDMLPVALGDLKGYVACEYVFVPDEVLVTPTPTPETGGEDHTQDAPQSTRYATVTASSGLKLREEPHTGARTLTTMPMGSTVEVTGEETGGFYPVRYGGMTGYAGAAYLNLDAQGTPIPVPTATPAPTPAPESSVAGCTGTVAAPSGLNLRAGPTATAQVLATLGYGVSVTVTGEAVDGFYPVRVGTLAGYVSADYVRLDGQGAAATAEPTSVPTAEPTPVPEGAQESAYRVVVESGNGLNLRARPDTAGEVLYVLPYGMVLTVLGEAENGFLHVSWAGYEGYVAGAYVAPFGAQGGE